MLVINSPVNTTLKMIVSSFVHHNHYDMFRPVAAGRHRVELQLYKRTEVEALGRPKHVVLNKLE